MTFDPYALYLIGALDMMSSLRCPCGKWEVRSGKSGEDLSEQHWIMFYSNIELRSKHVSNYFELQYNLLVSIELFESISECCLFCIFPDQQTTITVIMYFVILFGSVSIIHLEKRRFDMPRAGICVEYEASSCKALPNVIHTKSVFFAKILHKKTCLQL